MINPLNKILATEEECERRLDICKKCDRFRKETGQCTLKIIDGIKTGCNCFMVIKTKLLNARCNIGKWETQKDI